MMNHSVQSYRPLLSELNRYAETSPGSHSVEEAHRRCVTPDYETKSPEACTIAAMALHKRMGLGRAAVLVEAGFTSPAGLDDFDRILGVDQPPVPRRSEVAVWVRVASSGSFRR